MNFKRTLYCLHVSAAVVEFQCSLRELNSGKFRWSFIHSIPFLQEEVLAETEYCETPAPSHRKAALFYHQQLRGLDSGSV